MKENRDEITALQVLYSRPYRERLTFEQVKELAAAIEKPPHGGRRSASACMQAVDRSRVRGGKQRVLTDTRLAGRFALHEDEELVAFPERVRERFQAWLLQQENAGREFAGDASRLHGSRRQSRRRSASRSRTSPTRRSSSAGAWVVQSRCSATSWACCWASSTRCSCRERPPEWLGADNGRRDRAS